ncbi:hypothetical protein BO94DRAFT_614269, partial [Aspergillus sclerotioniger CBS 115572]
RTASSSVYIPHTPLNRSTTSKPHPSLSDPTKMSPSRSYNPFHLIPNSLSQNPEPEPNPEPSPSTSPESPDSESESESENEWASDSETESEPESEPEPEPERSPSPSPRPLSPSPILTPSSSTPNPNPHHQPITLRLGPCRYNTNNKDISRKHCCRCNSGLCSREIRKVNRNDACDECGHAYYVHQNYRRGDLGVVGVGCG